MKKTLRPFTVEVKRARLPERQRSTFQRLIPTSDLTEAETAAAVFRPLNKGEQPPLLNQSPTLADRSAERVVAEELAAPATGIQEPIRVSPAVAEPEAVTAPVIDHVVQGEPAPRADQQMILTRKRRTKPTAEDLPRGARWKRRLPQTAW